MLYLKNRFWPIKCCISIWSLSDKINPLRLVHRCHDQLFELTRQVIRLSCFSRAIERLSSSFLER